jgi:uncharacterized protein (DUF433 family)
MNGHPFVEEMPGNNGGYPVVACTRIPVRIIVQYYQWDGSIDGVRERLPHLSREQVQGALDYYRDTPARVDEDIERNERAWQERPTRA